MPSAERGNYMTRATVVKSLRTSDVVNFSGESTDEDAEDCIQSLDEVVIDDRLADVEVLCAVSTVLREGARRWSRTNRHFIATWLEFKAHFKCMYVKEFHPLGDAQLARMAYRNLYPSYRRAFGERTPMTLEDIEDGGIQFEKLRPRPSMESATERG